MRAEGSQRSRHRLDPVRLLLRAARRRRGRRSRRAPSTAASANSGSSSISRGTSAGSISVATRSACSTSMSATGSPPDGRAVVERDPRAHPLEHVQQARAGRVDADAGDAQARAGQQRGRDDERRRRGEVAGNGQAQRVEPLDRPRSRPSPASSARAPRRRAASARCGRGSATGSTTVVGPAA